jgi:simple sugar transport system permease protein
MKLWNVAGMAVGLVLVLVLTLAVFGLPVGPSLALIGEGAFGDKFAIARTLVKATPLVLTGLGMVVAWKGGMYNIGGEGQYIIGAMFAATVVKGVLPNPHPLYGPLILVAAVVGGAGYGLLAGWLYVARGVEVVISTILLNFVAVQLLRYAVTGPLQEAKRQVPESDLVPKALALAKFDRQMDLHIGTFIALAMVVVVWLFLFYTRAGYRIRLVGDNRNVARANFIPAGRVQLLSMAVSGGLCGLAGGIEYLGPAGQLGFNFPQDWGFLGIPIALLAGLNPAGVVPAAIYFGALFAGSDNLARYTTAGPTMIFVIQAVAVLGFVGLSTLRLWRKTAATGAD